MRGLALSVRDLSVRMTWVSFIRMTTIALLFVFVYYPVIVGLIQDWSTHPEYSHGFLVPVISGYLIWRRRSDLQCSTGPSVLGFGLLLFSLATFLLGWVAGEEFIQRLALPMTVMGLVCFVAGGKAAKACLFPIGYLFLMIPLPFPIYKALALHLRLFDATLSTSVASVFGVPVFQDGYLLHLPRITLEVADGCSGTLSIMALLALGTFYVGQMKMGAGRKILLWTMMIPVSVLANVVRIATIVIVVHYSGNWILDTTFHKLNGTFNFVLGFVVIVLIGGLISRIPLRPEHTG